MPTMAQKIVTQHCQNEIHGETVIALDRVFCHEITTPAAIRMLEARHASKPFDAPKVKAILDHVTPSKDSQSAQQAQVLRQWSNQHGVEFFDVGHNGVCHVVFSERGFVHPGMTVVMGDSHTCTYGAWGALAFGIGTTELAVAMARGIVAMPDPQSIRVELQGTRAPGVEAKDVALAVVRHFGQKGATGFVLEFVGEAVHAMDMEERATLCNMVVECGATTGICPVDAVTVAYAKACGISVQASMVDTWMQCNSDADATYAKTITMDVGRLVPVTTVGTSPDQVVPMTEVPYTPVQQVWIGSCTNGRIGDLRRAAAIVRGKQIAPGVRAIVTPASTEIWKQAMAEGLFTDFANAGFCVTSPGCGACIGMSGGVLAPGEVCASTSNRNFAGRMGAGGMVHLMSPSSAAQVALQGYMGIPKGEFVCE